MLATTGLLLWSLAAATAAMAAAEAPPNGYAEKKTVAALQLQDQSNAGVDNIDYDHFKQLVAKRLPKTLGRMIGRRLSQKTDANGEGLAPTGNGNTLPRPCIDDDDHRDPGCNGQIAFVRETRGPSRQMSSFVRIGRQAPFGYEMEMDSAGRSSKANNIIRRRGGPSSFIRIGRRSPIEENELTDPVDALIMFILGNQQPAQGYLQCDDDDDDDDRFPDAAAAESTKRRCRLMNAVLEKLRLQQLEAAWRELVDDKTVDESDIDVKRTSLSTATKRGPSSFIRLGRSATDVEQRGSGEHRATDGTRRLQMKLDNSREGFGQRLAKTTADVNGDKSNMMTA